MTQHDFLRYVVENNQSGERAVFECESWLESREQAVLYAQKLKSESSVADDYKGIKLCLEFAEQPNGDTIQHEILTGQRMHTVDILTALHREAELLTQCDKEFEVVESQMDDDQYRAVTHRHATLYYFTVSSNSDSSPQK